MKFAFGPMKHHYRRWKDYVRTDVAMYVLMALIIGVYLVFFS